MKLFLLLLSVSTAPYAMTFTQAQEVYQHLASANGIKYAPRLVLSQDTYPNASETSSAITINVGMLSFAKNEDEMAMVLGHELGHFTRNDHGSTPIAEFAADRLGATYEDKAGYSHCRGILVIERFHDKADSTHPDSDERYNRLKCTT